MAETKKKKKTGTSTTGSIPPSSYSAVNPANTAKGATDRVNAAVAKRKAEAPKAPKQEVKGNQTITKARKPGEVDDKTFQFLVKNQTETDKPPEAPMTTTSTGVDYKMSPEIQAQYAEPEAPVAPAQDPYAYARQGIKNPVEDVGQLPPAQELPPDAPLWLKLIRGVLTPVPPLAMIPHMFIQDYERKREAAQAADAKNMKYFWDLFDNNPMAAAQLAKTPLFRDTLQRRHGFDAEDLKAIQDVATAYPFKGSEMANLLSSGVAERAINQPGINYGDTRYGKIQQPEVLSAGQRMVSPEGTELYSAPKADFNAYWDIYRKDNPGASKLEAYISKELADDQEDLLGVQVAGDRIYFWDKTKPFDKLKKDKDYFGLNTKNLGKAQVKVLNDATGGAFAIAIIDPNVQNAKVTINPDTKEEEINYKHKIIPIKDILYSSLLQNMTGEESDDELFGFATDAFSKILKNLKQEAGVEEEETDQVSVLAFEELREMINQAKQNSPTTTNSISPEVQQYQ